MITFDEYKTADIKELEMHPSVILWSDIDIYDDLSYEAFTVRQNGKVVACFGAVFEDDLIMQLWMFTGVECKGAVLLAITRFTETWFLRLPATHLKIMVREDFDQARRWAKILGFEIDEIETKIEGWVDLSRRVSWAA